MNIFDLERAVSADKNFAEAFTRMKPEVPHGVGRLLEETFGQIMRLEHAGELALAVRLNDVFWDAAGIAFRYFDDAGLNRALGRHAKLLDDFSFAENLPALLFDHLVLVERLGVPHQKATHYWHHLDAHRREIVRLLAAEDFKFEALQEPGRSGFMRKGEPWQHMSPGLWTKLAGGVLVVANVGLLFGTASIGAGLAWVSCVAGAGGVGLG
jgi:hypothetical protein